MDSMWEKLKKGVREGAALSMEKIEEYTKLGKLKVEELATKRKIERNYGDIGERVFDLFEDGKNTEIAADLTIKKAVENIAALREELVEIDKKIKEVSENSRSSKEDEESEINGI
ncbi:MAG TPA: hypothetical protein VHP36_06325 [Chitinispirillaceae bacterium]|nr:hypothetical protein [Chitinispirillaceae bacterium]